MPEPLERHYSPAQVAAAWGLSERTIRRQFQDLPGVLKIGGPSTSRRGAGRFRLRIPESLLRAAHENGSAGFGAKVERRGR